MAGKVEPVYSCQPPFSKTHLHDHGIGRLVDHHIDAHTCSGGVDILLCRDGHIGQPIGKGKNRAVEPRLVHVKATCYNRIVEAGHGNGVGGSVIIPWGEGGCV